MINGKKILAIIPAREGSKRLPNKNILNLAGKPLIAWSIEAAKASKYIDTVIVSTDSEKIATISKSYHAEVPFLRPGELATDEASSIDVILHAIQTLKEPFDYILLLQPTSPLRTTQDIDAACELMNENTQAVVSVCETEHSPLWSNILPDNLSMKDFIRPEIKNKRSQDLPKYYRLNGAIYIAEINYLSENKGFFGTGTKAYIMPAERSTDIDTELDFKYSELLLKEK